MREQGSRRRRKPASIGKKDLAAYGLFIKLIRIWWGLDQEKLAKAIGIGQPFLSLVELGRFPLNKADYDALLTFFEIDEGTFARCTRNIALWMRRAGERNVTIALSVIEVIVEWEPESQKKFLRRFIIEYFNAHSKKARAGLVSKYRVQHSAAMAK